MLFKKTMFLLTATFFVSVVNGEQLPERKVVQKNLSFDRLERNYLFQDIAPTNTPAHKFNPNGTKQGKLYPLIIALHSGGQTAIDVFKQDKLSQYAYANGYYFIAPNAYKGYWNDFRDVPLSGDKVSKVDDLAFILTILSKISRDHPIDQQSVFVTGFSNGGYLTQFIGCRAIGSVQGIATIGATMTYKNGTSCINRNLPTLMINAQDDSKTPIYGNTSSLINEVTQELTYAPFETYKVYSLKNGCKELVNLQPLKPGSSIQYSESLQCSGSYKNIYYQFAKLGHNIPGVSPTYVSNSSLTPNSGSGSNEIQADSIIIDFFNNIIKHRKSKE